MSQNPSLGRIVRYVGPNEQICAAVVTNVFALGRVNLQLFRDGVNQAELPDYAYTVDFAPVDPVGGVQCNTWHWPPR